VFTKNCTEGLNIVAKGYPFPKGAVVLTTDMEHNSNTLPWLQMHAEGG
jgi:cysteine desulfurase/selenocysteine lyase